MTGREKNTRKRRKKPVFTRKMQIRIAVLFIGIILLFFGLSIRLLYINNNKGDAYTVKVLEQQNYSSTVIPFKRGDILDRNGVTLATSVKVYNMILDPKVMFSSDEYLEPTLNALSECFGYDKEELRSLVTEKKDSSYLVYQKKMSYEEISAFIDMQNDTENNPNIKGVWFESEYERKYPYSSLACHVLGFTSAGNVGTWGIEEYYDSKLDGVDGREYGYVNSENIMEQVTKAAKDGNTVVSTIDFNVQTIVEKYIKKYNEIYQPENIGVIVMDPNSGEIYAMATSVSYDLNNPRDLSGYYTQEQLAAMTVEEQLNAMNKIWRNYCLSDSFEPGSTFKPMTIAAALEEAKITPEQQFVCDGAETINTTTVHCHKKSGHGTINITQAISYSCNDVLMQVSALLGIDTFAGYQQRFNFGIKTGIDLPGEASCAGLLYTAETMKPIDLAICSFGQSFNVTMVQLASSFCSVINGGDYYQPHVVKEVLNEKGGVVEEVGITVIKKTVTQETSDIIKLGLIDCVEGGTGTKAKVNGYTIGGKTGTAQKLPREEENYVYSFIGYAGAKTPEVVCYCVVDNPNDQMLSTAASAKLFSDIMSESLPYLGVFPDKLEELTVDTDGDGVADAPAPNEDIQDTINSMTPQQPVVNNITDNPNGDGDGEVPLPYVQDGVSSQIQN